MLELTEFVPWASMATYSGALVMTLAFTQLTKGLKIIEKIPTQLWSYILALFVLTCANTFTVGITMNIFFQCIFNAGVVSLGANGGYSAGQKLIEKLFGNG